MNEIDQQVMLEEVERHVQSGLQQYTEKIAREQAERERNESERIEKIKSSHLLALNKGKELLPEWIRPYAYLEEQPCEPNLRDGILRIGVPGCVEVAVIVQYHPTIKGEFTLEGYAIPTINNDAWTGPEITWRSRRLTEDLDIALGVARDTHTHLMAAQLEFKEIEAIRKSTSEKEEQLQQPPLKYEPVVDDDPDPSGLINYAALEQFVRDAVDERLDDLGYMVVEDL